MRCRVRAERRVRELLADEQAAGRMATKATGGHREASSTATPIVHGITRDRAARTP
jgi:hypothetical protein